MNCGWPSQTGKRVSMGDFRSLVENRRIPAGLGRCRRCDRPPAWDWPRAGAYRQAGRPAGMVPECGPWDRPAGVPTPSAPAYTASSGSCSAAWCPSRSPTHWRSVLANPHQAGRTAAPHGPGAIVGRRVAVDVFLNFDGRPKGRLRRNLFPGDQLSRSYRGYPEQQDGAHGLLLYPHYRFEFSG